jgi:hypothetical protein
MEPLWVLLLYLVSLGGTSSQNSLLVHDVCRRVSEPQLFCVAVNAVVLLKFVQTMQASPFGPQVELTVSFRIASNLALVLSSFSSARVFCVFFSCLDSILLPQTFPLILNLVSCLHVVVRKLSSEFTTFILGSALNVYTVQKRVTL